MGAKSRTPPCDRCEPVSCAVETPDRRIVEGANVAMVVTQNGWIRYSNPKGMEITGYSLDELTSRPFLDFIHPDDRARLAAIDQHTLDGGHSYSFVYRVICKDGQLKWMEAKGAQTLWDNHPASLAFVTDITPRIAKEETLRINDERMRLGLEGSEVDLWDLDVLRNEMRHSIAWFELLGYSPTDGPDRESLEFWASKIHPEDQSTALKIWQDMMTGITIQNEWEYRQQAKSGEWRWMLSRAKTIERDPAGRPLRIVGVSMDVTERRKTQEALRQSENNIRTILDHLPLHIGVVDASRKFILWNKCSEQMFGYSPQEAIGRLGPADLEPVPGGTVENMAKLMNAGEYRDERWLVRKDGTQFMARLHVIGVRDEKTQAVTLYGVASDITEQVQAEQTRRRLLAAVDQMNESIMILDPQELIQYVNPAFVRTTGYTLAEVLGRHPILLASGCHDEMVYENLRQTIRQGRVWTGRLIDRRKDGSLYEQYCTISPVFDNAGQIINFVCVVHDLTHERMLERRLNQAEQLATVGATVTEVSHQIKNITNCLQSSVEIINQMIALDRYGRLPSIWGIYRRNTDRLSELTRQMLSYSKILDLKLDPADLNAIVRDAYAASAAWAAGQQVELTFTPAEALPLIPCHRSSLYDSILNVVGNAIEACAGQGRGQVRLITRLHAEASQVALSVEDDGPGIPREILGRIFDVFFSTKGQKGTGLGLATVQKTIHEHGGSVDVESRPGCTVFTLRLPL